MYSENIQNYGQRKTNISRNQKFNEAIDEVEFYLKQHTKSSCNKNSNKENLTEQLSDTSINLSFGLLSKNEEMFTDDEVSDSIVQLMENLKQVTLKKKLQIRH